MASAYSVIIIIGSAVLRDTGTLQATDLGKSYDGKDLKRRERSGTFPLVRTAAPTTTASKTKTQNTHKPLARREAAVITS